MTQIFGKSCGDPDQFRRLLDEHYDWPSPFMFKFIVPAARLEELRLLLGEQEFTTRTSSKGKYVSVSLNQIMESSEAVIGLYTKVSVIEGLVAL